MSWHKHAAARGKIETCELGGVRIDCRLELGLAREDVIEQAAAVGGWHGVAGQEHRQPLRRARNGVVGLRQSARHNGRHHVRGKGAEGGGDADEDERAEARSMLLRLYMWGNL